MPFYAKKWGVDLTFAGKCYESSGWSVIPLLGSLDSSRAKLPAIKWGRYQHTRPSPSEIEDWFLNRGFGGLGIVCGRVSNLVVLDFDDEAKVSEFIHLHPHLAETRTVQSGTRHLPHFYYHLPTGLNAHTRSVPGVDFRADGSYVVAPPTCVGDAVWEVVKDIQPRTMSADDLKAIWRWMASTLPKTAQNGSNSLSGAISDQTIGHSQSQNLGGSDTRCMNSDTTQSQWITVYQSKLGEGRNNALFQTACLARDSGLTQSAVSALLANVHALQASAVGEGETFKTRHIEALRTIASAFTRPPRKNKKPHRVDAAPEPVMHTGVGIHTPDQSLANPGLVNSVREWMLNHGLTAAARVLDGLYLAGLKAGAVFTEREACSLLETFRIGRRSVMNALKALLPSGQRIFATAKNPLHTSPIQANAAIDLEEETTKCQLSRLANRVKTSGRPAAYYVMPDAHEIALQLELADKGGDTLTADDLASPTAYRQAIHRELVKRRPGTYPRAWLAGRLGVSNWTTRRYDAALKIQVQPTYVERRVSWTNVETLLVRTIQEAPPGTFIETADGKRYPPLYSIGLRLLDQGYIVTHKRQGANHYTLSDDGVGIQTPIAINIEADTTVWKQSDPAKIEKDSRSHRTLFPSAESLQKYAAPNMASLDLSKGVGIHTPLIQPPATQSVAPNPQVSEFIHLSTQHSALSTEPTVVGIHTPAVQHSFWLCPDCLKTHIATQPPETCARCDASDWERVPDAIWRDPERLKYWWQARWRDKHPSAPSRATPLVRKDRCINSDTSQPLPINAQPKLDAAAEAAAHHAHELITGLSLNNARRLVSRYGTAALEKVLRQISQRGGIFNPAGFLVTTLRSEHLFYSQNVKPKPRPTVNSSEWVEKMEQSDFVDFLANADEFTT
jgi:hypothetical protein